MLRRMRRSPRCFFVVILGCLLLVSCLLPKHDGPVLVAGWSSGRNRAPTRSADENSQSPSRIPTTVIIIGAGAAGISAAKILQEANVEFVMIEGRDRIGGRFQQTELGTSGYIVEEGANWIHGPLRVTPTTTKATNTNNTTAINDTEKNNPLWEYAVQYDLAGNYTNYTNYHMTDAQEGTRIPSSVTQHWSSRVDQALDYCDDKSKRARRQWFQQQHQQQTVTEITTEELDLDRGGVEDEDMSIEQCLEECGYYNTTGSISNSSSNSSITNTSTSNTNTTNTTMMAVGELLAWMKTEFESGQPASSISNTQAFALQDAASYEDRDYLITDQRGYQHWMVRFVEDNLNADQLYLNHTVTKVEAFSEHATNTTVIVTTQEGTQFVSDYVLCTVPLGVLQHQLIDFVPDFSDERSEGIQGMTMGHYAKLYLQFATNFWGKKKKKNTTTNEDDDDTEGEDAPELLLTTTETRTNGSRSEEALQFPWALNLDLPKYLPGSKILAFHVCCDTARRLETQPLAETVEAAVALLRTKYGMDRVSTVTQVHVTNWTHDRYAGYGSYPDWPVGYTPQQHTAMIAPHGNIHFAGDHTHAQLFGYGHGAILTGRREAKAIISKLETNNDTHTWTTIE